MLKDSFKAMANPARLNILALLSKAEKNSNREPLAKQGELSVHRILDGVSLSPSTISHHLNVLKKAGLVKARKDKQWVYYSLNRGTIDEMKDYLARL
ncbi:MAG: metalloregulator ArsR/SmtB family transcription factor [Firmicutes bacterium]|nr:metalloregulator ArsR/SmtB family transcription factor [Bacillota bacterium]